MPFHWSTTISDVDAAIKPQPAFAVAIKGLTSDSHAGEADYRLSVKEAGSQPCFRNCNPRLNKFIFGHPIAIPNRPHCARTMPRTQSFC